MTPLTEARLTFGFLALITVIAIVYWLANEMWAAAVVGVGTLCSVGAIYLLLVSRLRHLERLQDALNEEQSDDGH